MAAAIAATAATALAPASAVQDVGTGARSLGGRVWSGVRSLCRGDDGVGRSFNGSEWGRGTKRICEEVRGFKKGEKCRQSAGWRVGAGVSWLECQLVVAAAGRRGRSNDEGKRLNARWAPNGPRCKRWPSSGRKLCGLDLAWLDQ